MPEPAIKIILTPESRRMVWQMKFNQLLTDVETFARSVCYWEEQRSHGKQSQREAAVSVLPGLRQGLNTARDALQAWVEAHPYPAGEKDP